MFVYVSSLSRVFDGFALKQSHSAHLQSFLEDLSEAQCMYFTCAAVADGHLLCGSYDKC